MTDQAPPHPYIPPAAPETSPPGYADPATRRAALDAVLEGVHRGAYGERIVDWLLNLDDPTIRTFASLMWQCRLAGRAEALPEGVITATQWGVRYSDPRGVLETAWYDDEKDAREHTLGISPPLTATVVSRQTWWTRWTGAPEAKEGGLDDRGR